MDEIVVHFNDKLLYYDQLISTKVKIRCRDLALNSWYPFLHLGDRNETVLWYGDLSQGCNPDCWVQSAAQWTLDLYTLVLREKHYKTSIFVVNYSKMWREKP